MLIDSDDNPKTVFVDAKNDVIWLPDVRFEHIQDSLDKAIIHEPPLEVSHNGLIVWRRYVD